MFPLVVFVVFLHLLARAWLFSVFMQWVRGHDYHWHHVIIIAVYSAISLHANVDPLSLFLHLTG